MSSKRRGWKSQRNLYYFLTRDLQSKAAKEFVQPVLDALLLCYEEVRQFHALRHPDCHKEREKAEALTQEGQKNNHLCPAWEAMLSAEKQFKRFNIKQER